MYLITRICCNRHTKYGRSCSFDEVLIDAVHIISDAYLARFQNDNTVMCIALWHGYNTRLDSRQITPAKKNESIVIPPMMGAVLPLICNLAVEVAPVNPSLSNSHETQKWTRRTSILFRSCEATLREIFAASFGHLHCPPSRRFF